MIRLSTTHSNLCEYEISMLTVVLFRGPIIFSLYANVYCLIAMAIERIVATIFFRQYENSEKFSNFRLILVVCQVCEQMIFVLKSFFSL